MKTNILLIINPKAGSIDVPVLLSKIEQNAERHNFKLYTFQTTGNEDALKIKEKLAATAYSRIIVAGGDGTINLVASIILESDLTMGILSCGSANGLATALEIPKNLDDQLQIALSGKPIRMDCIEINNHICLHISDLGINAELIYNFDKKKIRGIFGYFLQTLPTLKNSQYPYDFHIEINKQRIKKRGILLAFANASKYGTGAIINPKGSMDDGKFEIILFKKLNFLEILKTFFSNQQLHPSFAESYCVNDAKVLCDRPVALQVDGEYLGEFQEINAKIRSQVVNIAVPLKDQSS